MYFLKVRANSQRGEKMESQLVPDTLNSSRSFTPILIISEFVCDCILSTWGGTSVVSSCAIDSLELIRMVQLFIIATFEQSAFHSVPSIAFRVIMPFQGKVLTSFTVRKSNQLLSRHVLSLIDPK